MAAPDWKNQNNLFGVVLFFFILLFLYTKFIGPFPFFVQSIQTNKDNLFQVQGTGQATAIPNTAQISFGVTKNATTVADAQNQVNTAVSNILNGFKSLGVDAKDITTTDYSVDPQYNYTNGNQTPNGYSVTQTLNVKLSPIEKASKAVDMATANGANVVNGVTFTVDDNTQKQLEDKARTMAVNDAKQKAQSLAGAAGMHLGKIVDIQEDNNQPAPRPLFAAGSGAKAESAGVPTQLPTGQSTITSNVTISYETF